MSKQGSRRLGNLIIIGTLIANISTGKPKPTLRETTDWLAARLPDATDGILLPKYESHNAFRELVSFDGCIMKVESHDKSDDDKYEYEARLLANLSQVAKPTMETRFAQTGSFIILRTLPNTTDTFRFKAAVKFNESGRIHPQRLTQEKVSQSHLTLNVADSMRDRIVKALKHTIELCGGAKKEAF